MGSCSGLGVSVRVFCSGFSVTIFFGLAGNFSFVTGGFFSIFLGFSSCFTIFRPYFLSTLTGSFFSCSFVGGVTVVLTTLAFFTEVVDFFVVFFIALLFTFVDFFAEVSLLIVALVFLDVTFVLVFLVVNFLVVFGVTFSDSG